MYNRYGCWGTGVANSQWDFRVSVECMSQSQMLLLSIFGGVTRRACPVLSAQTDSDDARKRHRTAITQKHTMLLLLYFNKQKFQLDSYRFVLLCIVCMCAYYCSTFTDNGCRSTLQTATIKATFVVEYNVSHFNFVAGILLIFPATSAILLYIYHSWL